MSRSLESDRPPSARLAVHRFALLSDWLALGSASASPADKTRARRRSARRRLILDIELFEDRTLLSTIVWSNMGSALFDTDGFNTAYGTDSGIARTIVQTAIQAWEQVIENFNYVGVGLPGNAPAANTYTLNVSALDMGGTLRGDALITGVDLLGKPFSADIRMDDDGGGRGWYFDPNPANNAEFTDLLNRFTATFDTGTGNDFYRTILHEIGHAMGISRRDDLAMVTGGFLTPAGTDQRDSSGDLLLFTGATTTATFTTIGGTHIYEGPADPAFPDNPLNPSDLMNPGRTVGPPPTRQLITDLDASILRDAYGYTIVMPSTIQTFLANFNTITGELTINGDVETDWAGVQTFVDDLITIDRQGADLRVDINGLVVTYPLTSVTSLRVVSTGGDDTITIDFAGGSPIPVGGAFVDGGPPNTLPGDSLTIANQGVNTPILFTPSTTGLVNPKPGRAIIGGGPGGAGGDLIGFINIEAIAFDVPIRDFAYVAPSGANTLKIDSPAAGQNQISGTNAGAPLLPFIFSQITNFVLETGDGNDRITLASPGLVAADLRNFTINTGDGNDLLVIEAGADFRLPVPGGAFTYNAGGQTTASGDRLRIRASGNSQGAFHPDGVTARSGRFIKDGTTLFTSSLEWAEVDGFANFALNTPNDGDEMTITPEFFGAGLLENRIDGSSGGVAFSWLSFYDVTNFLIDSRANNVGGLLGNHYTIHNPGDRALEASGLRNFTIRSSAGHDVLTINADDFRLPVAGGEFLFDAGTGHYPDGSSASNLRGLISLDRIVVSGDVDFLLEDVGTLAPDGTPPEGRLLFAPAGSGEAASALLGTIRLIGVEGASLAAGPSGSRMDGSGFSGSLLLQGGAGNDVLVGGSGDNELDGGEGDNVLYAGNDRFARPGLGSQHRVLLGGGGTNLLFGGGSGRNTFHASLNGTATLIGGSGDNLFVITNPPDGVIDPVGGLTIIGAGKAGDILQLVGGGGPDFNQTYLLGPSPGEGNIVVSNNHNIDGPTISQFIRFSGIAVIDDSIVADKLIVVPASESSPISGVSSDDLASGVLRPTIGGLPFGEIQFSGKSAPSALLADGQWITLPPPSPIVAPLAAMDHPSMAFSLPTPKVAVSATSPEVAVSATSPEVAVSAMSPVPVAPLSATASIAETPARPGPFRPIARRLPEGRLFGARPIALPIARRPPPLPRLAMGRPLARPLALRPIVFAQRGPLAKPPALQLAVLAPRGPLVHLRLA